MQRASKLVTVEEHTLCGGFGSAVLEALCELGLHHVPVLHIGIHDHFVEHGRVEELRATLKLDANGIYEQVKAWLQQMTGQWSLEAPEATDRQRTTPTGP